MARHSTRTVRRNPQLTTSPEARVGPRREGPGDLQVTSAQLAAIFEARIPAAFAESERLGLWGDPRSMYRRLRRLVRYLDARAERPEDRLK